MNRSVFLLIVIYFYTSQAVFGLTNFADIQCGQVSVKLNPKIRNPRIVGGTEAFRGEFPWIVSLQYRTGDQSHFCGGFLVNKRYVITAAHCLDSMSRDRINVIIGEHTIGEEEIPMNAFGIGVEELIVHPDFSTHDTTRNDIALLRLKKSIDWSPYVQPACLPSANDLAPKVGDMTSVAGWGYMTKEKDQISKTLMTVDIPVLSTQKCEESYEWTGTAGQLCAGEASKAKGACKGDSGSPLMSKVRATNNSLRVVGIHAGGFGCGQGMLSGIYTRIASYVSWIKYNIRP